MQRGNVSQRDHFEVTALKIENKIERPLNAKIEGQIYNRY